MMLKKMITRKSTGKLNLILDDDLPLKKPLKFHAMTIYIRSIFKEGGKLYQQDFLGDALYEL